MASIRDRLLSLEQCKGREQPRYTLSPETLAAIERLQKPDPSWQPPADAEPFDIDAFLSTVKR